MIKNFWWLVALFTILPFFPPLANAVAITLNPIDWGTANNDDIVTGFDRLSSHLEAASTGNSIHRALLEFDVSSISGDILSSTLVLRQAGSANPPNTIEIHGYIGDGLVTLDDAYFNNLLTTKWIDWFPSHPNDINTLISIDVTKHTFIGNDFIGFMLKMDDESVDHAQRFSDNVLPYLSVEYTPVPTPSSVLLLSTGIILLGLLKSYKNKNKPRLGRNERLPLSDTYVFYFDNFLTPTVHRGNPYLPSLCQFPFLIPTPQRGNEKKMGIAGLS